MCLSFGYCFSHFSPQKERNSCFQEGKNSCFQECTVRKRIPSTKHNRWDCLTLTSFVWKTSKPHLQSNCIFRQIEYASIARTRRSRSKFIWFNKKKKSEIEYTNVKNIVIFGWDGMTLELKHHKNVSTAFNRSITCKHLYTYLFSVFCHQFEYRIHPYVTLA